MKHERRTFALPVTVEKREGDARTIAGMAAVYYNAADAGTEFRLWDDMYERIMPGAFDRAVKEDDVRALFNHNPDQVLGRTSAKTCRVSVDAEGLRYEIDPPDTTCGVDVMKLLARGDITGSSFSFDVEKQTVLEEKRDGRPVRVRQIEAVRLYDVGPVTFPAYEATTSGLRAISDYERRDIESQLPQFKPDNARRLRLAEHQ